MVLWVIFNQEGIILVFTQSTLCAITGQKVQSTLQLCHLRHSMDHNIASRPMCTHFLGCRTCTYIL